MKYVKFYKLAPQASKKIDLKRTAKKMEESSDFDSDSDYELDTSVKQYICRSELQEKPAHKKRVVDKYCGVRKPRIDPKTGD